MAEMGKNLDSVFTRLIAEKEGIQPDKVTVAYIHAQREKRFYPKTRYNIGTEYSGYNTTGLKILTSNEFDEIEDRVDKFLQAS